MITDFKLDETAAELLNNVLAEEENIREACENILSDIGNLIGYEIPFTHHGHIQFGIVTGVRGHGRTYGIRIRNTKTGVSRGIETYDVFEALRRLEAIQ